MDHKMQATLNLSNGFGQFGNSLDFTKRRFPTGEVYFNCVVPWDISTVRVNARLQSSEDIMTLLLACDTLRRQGIHTIELFVPYLPYSRQDRVCKKGDSFSLSVLCAMLRALQVGLVTYDIHSNVAEVLLDGTAVRLRNNHTEVVTYVCDLELDPMKELVLVAPDAGARKKADELFRCGLFNGIVYANKTRQSEHVITCDQIKHDLTDTVCIVVDDICDGGGTVNALGHRLKQAGCEEAHLFVSHGIFSKGTEDLLKFYKTIGTTNSYMPYLAGHGVRTINLDY